MVHPDRINQVQKILSNKELLNIIRIKGKGFLFKELKNDFGVSFDEIAKELSEQYNYKVAKHTISNWACNQFPPPLSAIIFACNRLGNSTKEHVPAYLFPLLDE